MFQKVKLEVIFIFIFLGLMNNALCQEFMPPKLQVNISEIDVHLKKGDTLKAISLYRNVLKIDSLDKWKCKLLLELATLEFLKDRFNDNYKKTLSEAVRSGCDKISILEKYEFIFIKMKLNGNLNYSDSLVDLYSKMIQLNNNKGRYYYLRFLEKYYTKKDTISSEEDLKLAVKYGNKIAIWYLNDRNKKGKK